jgi:predicted PurR-regulated permease PerM
MKKTWDPTFRYIVFTIVFIFAMLALWVMRDALQPLLTAALAAYFLSPAVLFLTRRLKMRRKVAANVVYFFVLAFLIAVPFTALPLILDELQGILKDLNVALDSVQLALQGPLQVGNVHVDLSGLLLPLRQNLSSGFVPKPEQALQLLQGASRNFLWTLVILVTTYYLMTDWDRLRSAAIRIAPLGEQSDLHRLYREIRKVWMGYLGGQIRLMVTLAIIYSLAWSLIGLPGAIIIGMLAGLLNLLPEVGPAAAAGLATIVALLEGSTYLPVTHLWFAIITLGVYLLLNNIKTIWLQPRILGQSVLLHEGVVFVAIVTAIMLQGVLGVLIIVPLLATLGVIGRYLRQRLLGQPAFEEEAPASAAEPEPVPASQAESQPGNSLARENPSL